MRLGLELLADLSDFWLELDFALEDDFAEELLETLEDDFAELEEFAEELEATLDDDSLELDATELLEGNFSNWAIRLTGSVAVK